MVNSIVFSYNRASQLRLFLESVAKNAPELTKINIIYKFDNQDYEAGYEKIKSENILPNLNWVKETNFKENLVNMLDSSEFTTFFTDNDIIYKPISIEKIVSIIKEDDDIICFSLKLGENTKICYTNKSKNILLNQIDKGDYITWNWVNHYWDFGCPLSIGGHIFRTKDISKMVKKTNYINPNSLEESFEVFENFPRPLMASYKQSVLVISSSLEKKEDTVISIIKELNDKLLSNEIIDYNQLDFTNILGSHQDLEYKYKNL